MVDIVRALDRAPRWIRRSVSSVTQGRGPLGLVYDRVIHRFSSEDVPQPPQRSTAPVRVLIGPANEAEQGYQWARALERADDRVSATAMMGIDPGGFEVRADLRVPTPVYLRSAEWHDSLSGYLESLTHVLIESGLPLLGRRFRSDAFAEAAWLRERGVTVGALFHGSDLRHPRVHAEQSEWSPFHSPEVPSAILAERAETNVARVRELGLPAFVSTPDLLQFLPEARWCPVVVEPAAWAVDRTAPTADGPLVVLHAPSNSRMKGSEQIEPTLRTLAAEGLIEYRRVQGVRHSEMRDQYARADVVLDQFLIGSYGVAACEAISAGCLVIGHVDEATRDIVRQATGLEVPIVEATVRTLDAVLRTLAADRSPVADGRAAALDFVHAVHDGRRSAAALAEFLGATA